MLKIHCKEKQFFKTNFSSGFLLPNALWMQAACGYFWNSVFQMALLYLKLVVKTQGLFATMLVMILATDEAFQCPWEWRGTNWLDPELKLNRMMGRTTGVQLLPVEQPQLSSHCLSTSPSQFTHHNPAYIAALEMLLLNYVPSNGIVT